MLATYYSEEVILNRVAEMKAEMIKVSSNIERMSMCTL